MSLRTGKNVRRLKLDAVRREIQRQDLKLYWVADEVGVHKTTLRRWLSRRINAVATSRVERLAFVLGTEVQMIVDG